MVTFIVFCAIGALAAGLAVTELFGRRKRREARAMGDRIDAARANSLVGPPGNRTFGEYLPPPDDGRPQ